MRMINAKRSAIPVILLTAAWLVAADNAQFWHLIATVLAKWDQPNPWFPVSICIVVLTLVNLTLTLVTFGRATRYVLIALLCTSAAAAYFMDQYGIMFDHDMIRNIFETDRSESMELINSGLIMKVFVFGILPSAVIWRLVPARQSVSDILTDKAIVLGVSVVVVVAMAAPFFKDYASLIRNHREVRYLLTPTNYLQSLYTYAAGKAEAPGVTVHIGEDAHKGGRWAGVHRPALTVLVVGETARAANFSLGNYQRETNPRLAKDRIIYFSHVSSCGTSTRASLPCMFSDLTHEEVTHDATRDRESLLDVLNHAGIKTLWLDNNSGCKGVCANTPTWRPNDSEKDYRCRDSKCFDMVLLDKLAKILGSIEADTVLVLHQNGSHGPSYYRRYPDEFRRFEPECRSDELSECTREQIINSYDNTIYYTDYFLSELIRLLDESASRLDTAMMYVSDHGESLGEFGLYLHGAPYFLAPETQTHVPMLLWMSSGFRLDFEIQPECLERKHADLISHDYLFHSVLGLMNVETTVYDSKLDLFSRCTLSPVKADKPLLAVSEI